MESKKNKRYKSSPLGEGFSCISVLAGILLFISCNTNNDHISSNPAMIAAGEVSFDKNCSGCHNFKQDAIGPQLSGITAEVNIEWIEHFIKNPQQMINAGDKRATDLYKKYKVAMPSFENLSNDELKSVIAFLNVHKSVSEKPGSKRKFLSNPIPDTIALSNLVVELKQIVQAPASSDNGKKPLARITKLDYQPGSKDLFIVDLRGKLYRLHNGKLNVFMDIKSLKPKFINEPGLATGFGSFAFHPDFEKNGFFYTTHTEPPNSAKADFAYNDSIKVTLQWVLTEWKADDPKAETFKGKGRELLRVNMVSGIHGMQEIAFDPSVKQGDKDYGLLYIGIGDGGAVENGYPFLAHSRNKVWGTVLRIDPKGNNSANKQYGITATNPFTKDGNNNELKEIYAYGFRNPHRISWSKTGKMLVSNVGHGNIESLDLVLPSHDYGWPVREGSFVLNAQDDINKVYALPANDSSYHITYPVAEYDHDEGKAICGGFEYTGSAIPVLKEKFLFGDIPTGRLFYVNMNDIKPGSSATIKEWRIAVDGKEKSLRDLCGSDRVDLHFGRDADGELYILTKADGKVYKLLDAKE